MILDATLIKELLTPEDVELVLDTLGMTYKIEQGKLTGLCPSPEHQDRKPSWDINTQKHSHKFCVHSCFSCGYSGDIISLIQDRLGLSSRLRALMALNQIVKKTISEDYLYERNLARKKSVMTIKKQKRLKFKMPIEFELIQEHDPYYRYLATRGISDKIMERANIGKCETGYYRKRVIVPVYMNKKLRFYFARNNDKIHTVPKEKRGWYPKYSKSSEVVYPWDWIDLKLDYIIVVEGIFDCLRLWSLGYKNVVCIFGNRIHKTQVAFLKRFKKVILVPDADGELHLDDDQQSTRGMLMIQTAYELLRHSVDIDIIELPKGNDPGDVSSIKLKEAFKNPKKIYDVTKIITVVDYSVKKKSKKKTR